MNNYLRTYLRNRPLFYSLIRPKEAELFYKELPFKRPVLDFGCGDGFFADTIFKNDCRIDVGIDVNPEIIKEAEKLRIYEKVKSYDGKKIPHPENYFATVISNCVFEHLDDLGKSVSEIRRVLKPKGKLVTSVMTDNWEKYLFGSLILGDLYKRWMRRKQKHFNLLSSNEWQNVFKKNGFKVRKSVGYLDKTNSRWIDILHYISIGSLISKKIFNKWVIFPGIYNLFGLEEKFKKMLKEDIPVNKSAAIFYVLEKN